LCNFTFNKYKHLLGKKTSIMKKIHVLILAAGLMFISQEAMACWGFSRTHRHRAVEQQPSNPDPGAVGAPLDGGLLAILAAAGGAYFVARKKKKNQQ
jgi:hypothetical protein